MALIHTINVGGVQYDVKATHYATSTTTSSTIAKTAFIQNGNFTLETGVRISVKFTHANTASNPTLNVNSTGAKAIRWRDSNLITTQYWSDAQVVDFVYDGTYWNIVGALNNPMYTQPEAPDDAPEGSWWVDTDEEVGAGGSNNTKFIQSDWNQNNETADDFIKNRTHWSEPTYEIIVPSQFVEQHCVIDLGSFSQSVDYNFPEDITVVIDGISYEVSNWYDDFGNVGEKIYGDSRLGDFVSGGLIDKDSHPEDVPFLVTFTWYDEDPFARVAWGNSVYQLYIDFPEDKTYTVEVKKHSGTTYHKIDANYLPMDDIYNEIRNRIPIAEENGF